MKFLIVNADDFGASRGINRGVIELHESGILTSTSLMITMPAAADAVRLASSSPKLDVGLHVTLTTEAGVPLFDFEDKNRCGTEAQAQLERVKDALGRLPTHIDSHQNIHRDPRLLPVFQELAGKCQRPLREHSAARYFSRFYGQWDDGTHPEHISVENLLRMLESEVGEGVTELSCHPGYVDPDFESVYHVEREIELNTLRDGRVSRFVRELNIQLIGFRDLSKAAAGTV